MFLLFLQLIAIWNGYVSDWWKMEWEINSMSFGISSWRQNIKSNSLPAVGNNIHVVCDVKINMHDTIYSWYYNFLK